MYPCANETRKGEEKAENKDTQYKRDEGGKTENAYKEKTILHISNSITYNKCKSKQRKETREIEQREIDNINNEEILYIIHITWKERTIEGQIYHRLK